MKTWIYNFAAYDSESNANDAVTALKNQLDNQPTFYVEVKLLSGNDTDGWIIPAQKLTDEEINAGLNTDSYYAVSAVYEGISHVGLNGALAEEKIALIKRMYAQRCRANVMTIETAPSIHDMSGYV